MQEEFSEFIARQRGRAHPLANRSPAPSFVRLGLAALLVLFSRPAAACQICTMTILYNVFRFIPIWMYLLLLWTVVALIAGFVVARQRKVENVGGMLFVIPTLKVLGLMLIGILFGAHFLPLLAFPFLLMGFAL